MLLPPPPPPPPPLGHSGGDAIHVVSRENSVGESRVSQPARLLSVDDTSGTSQHLGSPLLSHTWGCRNAVEQKKHSHHGWLTLLSSVYSKRFTHVPLCTLCDVQRCACVRAEIETSHTMLSTVTPARGLHDNRSPEMPRMNSRQIVLFEFFYSIMACETKPAQANKIMLTRPRIVWMRGQWLMTIPCNIILSARPLPPRAHSPYTIIGVYRVNLETSVKRLFHADRQLTVRRAMMQ